MTIAEPKEADLIGIRYKFLQILHPFSNFLSSKLQLDILEKLRNNYVHKTSWKIQNLLAPSTWKSTHEEI